MIGGDEVRNIGANSPSTFSTNEVVNKLQKKYPIVWCQVVSEYGEGGKGCGRHYSAHSYVASLIVKAGYTRLGWVESPKGWGSKIMAQWGTT